MAAKSTVIDMELNYVTVTLSKGMTCLPVCSLSVCLSASIFLELHIRSSANFVHVPMAVARSSSGSVEIRYVFPVLQITSYLHVIQSCSSSRLSERSTCAALDLAISGAHCAVIPAACQRTHGPTFRALKVTPRSAAQGA